MRALLTGELDLAARARAADPPALFAPLVSPPLTPAQSEGLDLILEGFLLHHGHPRHLEPRDGGREVLAGDYCYAQGLVRVAESGDLVVIAALADLIALGAGLVASDDRSCLAPLWRATVVAIAARVPGTPEPPTTAALAAAKRRLRSDGSMDALEAIADALPPTPGLVEAFAP